MDGANVVALVIAVGSIIGSGLAYRRGSKADDAKNESTQATTAVAGFGTLTAYLQTEISRLGSEVAACRANEATQRGTIESQGRTIETLTREVRRLGGNV